MAKSQVSPAEVILDQSASSQPDHRCWTQVSPAQISRAVQPIHKTTWFISDDNGYCLNSARFGGWDGFLCSIIMSIGNWYRVHPMVLVTNQSNAQGKSPQALNCGAPDSLRTRVLPAGAKILKRVQSACTPVTTAPHSQSTPSSNRPPAKDHTHFPNLTHVLGVEVTLSETTRPALAPGL